MIGQGPSSDKGAANNNQQGIYNRAIRSNEMIRYLTK